MNNDLANILNQLVSLQKSRDTVIEISSKETSLKISNRKVVGEVLSYLIDKL